MQYTGRLKLKKPEAQDLYNVEDFNYNADVLDQQIEAILNNAETDEEVIKGLVELTKTQGQTIADLRKKIEDMGDLSTLMEKLFSRVVSSALTDHQKNKITTETGEEIELYFTIAIE